MTEDQKHILKEFKKLYGHLSYKKISEMTGLQKTRIFRVFQGAEMKLSEYVIFKKLIEERKKTTHLKKLVEKGELIFSSKEIQDLSKQIEKMMNLKNLMIRGGLV